MVGCTDYSEDIQNLGTEVDNKIESLENELDALRKSVAETYATIEDLNDLADEVDAVNNAVDALEATVAEKADKADVEAKITAVNAAIDDLKAKLDTKADKTALEAVEARVTALENEVKALDAEKADITYVEGEVDALKTLVESCKTELEGKISDLTAELEEEVAALEAEDKELQDQIDELKADVKDLKDAVEKKADKEYVDEEFGKIATQLSELAAADGRLQDQINTIITDLNKLTDRVAELETLYNALKKSTEEQIKALEDKKADKTYVDGKDKELQDKIDDLKNSLDKLDKKYEDALKEIEELLANKVDKAIFDATIANLTEELSNIASIAAQVPELLARVQSLVYVPDYSDHKATIQWALVNNGIQALNLEEAPAYTVLAKTSELKYLVKANTPADAESAAKAIEIAWEEVLDYLVEPVKIRTRSEEAVADLEIVDVTAKDDVVTVSVVAKNFDYKFFDNPEEGIYSAAIVLKDDKGNNLTSEYTNLVPGKAEEYQMALFVYAEDPQTADETLRMAGNDETITYLIPCTDTETVKSAVKPIVGFVPVIDGVPTITTPVSFYTPELLAEEGYDVAVDMDITLVDTENINVHDGTMDTKPGPISIDNYFNIEGGNPVYDFHYSVKPDVAFENVGKFSTVTYTFTCGNTVQNLTYRIELDNAQVEVNVGKYDEATGEYYTEVPWTVKLRDELTANGEEYAKNLEMAHIPYVGVDDIQPLLEKNNPLLSDWTKTVYVKTAGEWVADPQLTDAFVVTGWATEEYPKTISYAIKGGNYAWNNEYKVVYTSTNETEHIDLTTNVIIKLTYFPEEPFVLDFPVTFKMGANGSFQAAVDVLGEMYKKVTGDNEANYDYLGYGEKNADIWADYTADLVKDYQDGKYGSPVVNDNKLAAGYASNIRNLQLAQVAQNQYVDGVNTIEWAAEDIIDFDFDVTIHGEAYIPAYELIYSQDLTTVIDENTGRVHVYGEKTGDDQDATYTIDQADLAKYFNVNVNDVEGGLAEGHVLTVDFAVTDALDTEDVVIADLVQILPATTTDVEDNGATYLSLVRNNVVLHWNEYTGLEVPVRATLKLNGFEIGSRDITLWTEDPLTLKNQAQVIVKRAPGNENTVARIYENLLLTGILHGNQNLIEVPEDDNYETLFEDVYPIAKNFYGANLTIQPAMTETVYYEIDGKKITIDKNKYHFDVDKGTITLYGDDSGLNVTYIAKCYVTLTHKFCEDKHAEPQLVTVKFVPNN